MNCCDYNCNQGRDCPARVAKIGRKDHAPEPLPRSLWRERLVDLARVMLVVILVMLVSATTVMVLHA